MTQQNEIDKLKYGIPFEYCEFAADIPPQNYALGASYKRNENKFIFEVSGKLFATPKDLGSITSDNFYQIPNYIQYLFGITTDREYFYEGAAVHKVDIKKKIYSLINLFTGTSTISGNSSSRKATNTSSILTVS